jgi:hypothetical protein
VCSSDLLLRGLVARVHVRVIAASELAIGLANRVFLGVARDAERRIQALALGPFSVSCARRLDHVEGLTSPSPRQTATDRPHAPDLS